MAHFNVLVLSGGGAKGPYEMGVLEDLEMFMKKPLKEYVNLVVSTSVGAVIGSLLCSGTRTTTEWCDIVLENLPLIFTKRGWFFPLPIYDPQNYKKCYEKYVGKGLLLKDLPIKLMITSVDRVQPKTHYFKSWEDKDGQLPVTEATIRSFSAPVYFGASLDESDKKIWLDGGIGYNNLPLMKAYIEILRQGWLKDGNTAHIFAVGSGSPDLSVSFEKARKRGIVSQTIDQVRKFIDLPDGGLAREMSTQEQVGHLRAIVDATPNLTCQFINWESMPKKLDKMDDVKDRFVYYKKGLGDGLKIDPKLFKF